MARAVPRAVPAALGALLLTVLAAALPATAGAQRDPTTTLFSVALDGGTPNGASTNPVISMDARYSQLVAFESEASDLVAGDTNQQKDVFAVRRAGSFGDTGSEWKRGATQLVSRGTGGQPANGPSFDAAVDGNMKNRAKCVAFLSDASNLVSGDTNGQTDAFVAKAPTFVPKRVSLPGNKQATGDTTHVAVSGDCSRVAFVTGGKLYVRAKKSARVDVTGDERDPSYDTGDTNSLVFGGSKGVYLLESGKPRLIAKKGRNPGYINRLRTGKTRRYVAYERERGGRVQIAYRAVGGGERVVSGFGGALGDGDSNDPTIFNSGFFVSFTSAASNLSIKSSGARGDANGVRDAYLFADTFGGTLLESVDSAGDQFVTGAQNTSTSQYRNYVVFDSAGNNPLAAPQVYLRYLGGI